jgi:hypothetical protein
MKKLLLVFSAIFAFNGAVQAQTVQDSVIRDTIHYYFNKYYFKTATTLSAFPYYKSPAATVTVVTHVGSFFENTGDTLIIRGLEAFAAKNIRALPAVPVHLYLCNVNGKVPVFPPIDSVVTAVTSTVMLPIGGPLHNGPKKLTQNYAILFRNMSNVSGDTAHLLRTAGMTHTSNAQPREKNSEGNGIVRYNGTFYTATNYTAFGFGHGTDYEFCVAPRVTYSVHAAQQKPFDSNPDDTLLCTFEHVKFYSKTTSRISHRMYNLVEFRRRWDNNPPFHSNAVAGANLPADSSGVTWHFMPEDAINYHLPINSQTGEIDFMTDSSRLKDDFETPDTVCFDGNEFRVRLHGMNIRGGGQLFYYNETFDICTTYCDGTRQGVTENSALSAVSVYPNPAIYGRMTVSGLKSESQITVYNVLGQEVWRQVSDKPSVLIDLGNQPQGSYLLKISNSQGLKMVKVLNQ